MKSFKELREKTLTPAEKKKREEIAKAIEKDEPDMPMDKKMAIATAQAKKVAEGAEKYTVKKGNMTRKVDGATADKMKRQGWKLIATEGLDEAKMDKPLEKQIGMGDSRSEKEIRDQISGLSDGTLKKWASKPAGRFGSKIAKLQDKVVSAEMKKRGLKESVSESVELDEGAMSDFHLMVQEKVPAEKIAKELGLDLKTVKKLMKDMKESVDLEEGKLDESKSKKYYNDLMKTALKKVGRKMDPDLTSSFASNGDFIVSDRGVVVARLKKGTYPAMKESVQMTFFALREARKDSAKDTYFDTYSAAVQHAKAQAEKKGFEVVEDDWFNQVTTGKGKPGRGKTTRHTLKLTKNDKPVRQGLSIQVYNRDSAKKPYELNFYVS